MRAYLKSQGCALVGFERSMWCVTIKGHTILVTTHIDDFFLLVLIVLRWMHFAKAF
jgi:hypothetical protein